MRNPNKTKQLVLTAVLAALLAVIAPLTIPVGPIPFSLAIFGVFFISAMQPPLGAMASLCVYVLLGAVGLPVFSGFRGGPQVLVGATGGYIVGYFVMALVTSLAIRRTPNLFLQMVGAVLGLAGCYLLGTLWYMFVAGVDFLSAILVCVAPFAIPDIIKGFLALGIAKVVRTRIHVEKEAG